MRVAVSITGARQVHPSERFQYFKECGFEGVEFSVHPDFHEKGTGLFSDIENVTDEQIKEYYSALKYMSDKAGVAVSQTHGAFGGHPGSNNFNYDDIVARLIASIKATHYLGSKLCVIHPVIMPGRRYDLLKKEAFDKSVEMYKRLLPALEEYDVYCCIENMWVRDPVYGHICNTILSHADEMREMAELLGDRYKICLDTGHCEVTGDDVVEAVRTCGSKLACLHTHQTDGYGDLHTFPFSAVSTLPGTKPSRTNWEDFMKALKEIGYEGDLAFETGAPGPVELKTAGYKWLSAIGHYLVDVFENA